MLIKDNRISEAHQPVAEVLRQVMVFVGDSHPVLYSRKDAEIVNGLIAKHLAGKSGLDLDKTYFIDRIAKVMYPKGAPTDLEAACKLMNIVIRRGMQDYAMTETKCCAALLIVSSPYPLKSRNFSLC